MRRLHSLNEWQASRSRSVERANTLRAEGFDRLRIQAADVRILCGYCSSRFGEVGFADSPAYPLHPARSGGCSGAVNLEGAWRSPNMLERALFYLWEQRYEPMWAQTLFMLLCAVLLVALFPLYLPAWIVAVPTLWSRYPQIQTDNFARALAVLALLEVAAALYWLRSTNRSIYGIAEACLGTFICWHTFAANEPGDATTALKLGAAVYIVVRGLDNAKEGWGKPTFWHSLIRYGRATYHRYHATLGA